MYTYVYLYSFMYVNVCILIYDYMCVSHAYIMIEGLCCKTHMVKLPTLTIKTEAHVGKYITNMGLMANLYDT